MRIGYLLTPKDLDISRQIRGCDFIISEPLLSTSFPQDYITDFKNPDQWAIRSGRVFDIFALAERKQLRLWIPAIDLVIAGWELRNAIIPSAIDIVLFGSITPSDEIKKVLMELDGKKKNGNIYYAPLVAFEKHIAKYFDEYWNTLKQTDIFPKKTILGVIPDKPFIPYLKDHPDFCDELVLWNRPEELESDLLEIIERNNEMTKKIATASKKVPQISIKGTVAIGPLSVRKSPDLASRAYKILPQGSQLVIRKIEELAPGMIWGMVYEEQWVLISNGTRKFIILDN